MEWPPIFIDSGAHGLYNEHVRDVQHRFGYSWYETDAFTAYLDQYAAFIKDQADLITLYANVDVIYNPEMTWKSQQYLEEVHGLTPVPVIHHGTPLQWLEKYLEKGYEYIALGGLGQETTLQDYFGWGDKAFALICPGPSNLPVAKVHGFAACAHQLLTRYPWWSVDATTWIMFAAYGHILLPPPQGDGWRYDVPSFYIKVTRQVGKANPMKVGVEDLRKLEVQRIVYRYLEEKGFPLGRSETDPATGEEVVLEAGVTNNYQMRCELNALYFADLSAHLPPWPWPFRPRGLRRLL